MSKNDDINRMITALLAIPSPYHTSANTRSADSIVQARQDLLQRIDELEAAIRSSSVHADQHYHHHGDDGVRVTLNVREVNAYLDGKLPFVHQQQQQQQQP